MIDQYRLRVSSSIAPFREKAELIWKVKRYEWPRDILLPVIFFGMYHFLDYARYILHLGPKSILWAGSDLTNLINRPFPWYKLFRKADNYCENNLECKELDMYGIRAKIVPSFLEEIPEVSFKPSEFSHVYLSVRPNRECEYGSQLIVNIQDKTPKVIYHIYGMNLPNWKNVIYHGSVSNEQFNEEIKNYHCGLRPNLHDGFSEITCKSILMAQYPITRIKYTGIPNYETEEQLIKLLNSLPDMKEPNLEGREFYKEAINKFPWVMK